MIATICVPPGRDAITALRAEVEYAKEGDRLATVTVVVTHNYAGLSVRRALARTGIGEQRGVAGLRVHTLEQLADWIGGTELRARGRSPLQALTLTASIASVLAAAPGGFEPVKDFPATHRALARTYRELCQVSPDALEALRDAPDERGKDAVRVFEAVREMIESHQYDEGHLLAEASDVLLEREAAAEPFGELVLYLPERFTHAQLTFLAAFAEASVARRICAIAADGDDDVLDQLNDITPDDDNVVLDRLNVDERSSPASVPDAGRPTVRHVEVSDADEEARTAVETVIDAARGGVAFGRMAILYPSSVPYRRILHEQLGTAEVPVAGPDPRSTIERLAPRWLVRALALSARVRRREDLLAVLDPLRIPMDSSGDADEQSSDSLPSGAADRVTREAAITSGTAEQWKGRLERYAESQESAAAAERDGKGPMWLIERCDRRARETRALLGAVSKLYDRLDALHEASSWAELAAGVRTLLHEGDARLRDRRFRADPAERVAEAKLLDGLARLAALGDVPEPTVAKLRELLVSDLERQTVPTGNFGQGVFVAPIGTAVGVELDVVVILGIAEGLLPAIPREDPVLPDELRRPVLAELPLSTDRIKVQQRHFATIKRAATDRCVLLTPRGDLRGSGEATPSRWLERSQAGGEPAEQVASFAARRYRNDRQPATRREYVLAALRHLERDDLAAAPVIESDASLRAGIELILGRDSDEFTRFEGNISRHGAHLVETLEGPMSASRLELLATCPHAYFLRYLLRVDPIEEPEDRVTIDPRERGTLIHEILERWLGERIEAGAPAPGEPWDECAKEALEEIAVDECDAIESKGLVGLPHMWAWERARILDELRTFVSKDDDHRTSERSVPEAVEIEFGDGDAEVLELDGGRCLQVRGKIDRIDRIVDGDRSGDLLVIDYKTGRAPDPDRQVSGDKPFGDGTQLQLAIYGLVARKVNGESDLRVKGRYWYISSAGKWKVTDLDITEPVEEKLRATLRVLTGLHAAGHVPMRPRGSRIDCPSCGPSDSRDTRLDAAWQRHRERDELADYVALVDPAGDKQGIDDA